MNLQPQPIRQRGPARVCAAGALVACVTVCLCLAAGAKPKPLRSQRPESPSDLPERRCLRRRVGRNGFRLPRPAGLPRGRRLAPARERTASVSSARSRSASTTGRAERGSSGPTRGARSCASRRRGRRRRRTPRAFPGSSVSPDPPYKSSFAGKWSVFRFDEKGTEGPLARLRRLRSHVRHLGRVELHGCVHGPDRGRRDREPASTPRSRRSPPDSRTRRSSPSETGSTGRSTRGGAP